MEQCDDCQFKKKYYELRALLHRYYGNVLDVKEDYEKFIDEDLEEKM